MIDIDRYLEIISGEQDGETVRNAITESAFILSQCGIDISDELQEIREGHFGNDIRIAIHNALYKLSKNSQEPKNDGVGVISPMIIVPSSILVDHCEYDGYNMQTLHINTGGNVKWDSSITDLHPYSSYEYLEPDSTAAKNMLGDTIPHELPSRPLAMRFDVRDTDGNALSVNARFYVKTPGWKYASSGMLVSYEGADWFTPDSTEMYNLLDRPVKVDGIYRYFLGVEFAIRKGSSSYVLSAGEIAEAKVDVYF